MPTRSLVVPYIGFAAEAITANVGEARRRLVAFASEMGADRELQARVALAVSEAATNVVMHAYPDAGLRPLRVAADFEDGDLEVVVADEGVGLRPGRSLGLGAGLGIIAECADQFIVRERARTGVELWMRFHVKPIASVTGGAARGVIPQ
jgi:anti-sigma regulatory factor (Ser/Thr protein kinase)